MGDTTLEFMVKKIHNKIFGNGVPGMDKKIDNLIKIQETFSKDNANDHALIIRELRKLKSGHYSLKKKVDNHVKGSKLENRLKHAGHDIEGFLGWCVRAGKRVVEIIIVVSAIVAGTYGLFHKQINAAAKAIDITEIQEHTNNDN